jgi:hypothetical protein
MNAGRVDSENTPSARQWHGKLVSAIKNNHATTGIAE